MTVNLKTWIDSYQSFNKLSLHLMLIAFPEYDKFKAIVICNIVWGGRGVGEGGGGRRGGKITKK